MVKMTSDEFQIMKREVIGVCLLLCVSCFLLPTSAFSQQPQAPAGTPLYSANAKYVNGVAPGYWPTAGSGLTLNVSAGTAYCGNPPSLVNYAGGTLTMTASTTNYIYLDPSNNCAPAVSTSAFAAGQIPLAKVVAGTSSITTITDARTWFAPQPCSTSSSGAVDCSATGSDQDIALTPTGTGASVISNLEDKGGQVFNVKAYGAKGNGKTDDSPAFQAAYNAAVAAGGGTVLVPQTGACYLLDEPINMTSTKGTSEGVTIEGVSLKYAGVGVTAPGTICGNTGGIVFDTTGSSVITFRRLDVTSQADGPVSIPNPSLVGVYAARNSNGSGGFDINAIDCNFKMVVHNSGTTYSFGAYLYGAEIDHWENDTLVGDYPLVVTIDNTFHVNSAFLTESSSGISETDDFFTSMDLESSGLGPAAYFDGAHDMTLTGHSTNFQVGSSYSSSLQQYAIHLTGSCYSFFINFRQEGFPGFMYIDLNLEASYVMGVDAPSGSPPLHAVEFDDASSQIINNVFNIEDEYSTSTTNYYYDSTAAGTQGVAVLDHNDFYCGTQTNCIDIPVGNYQPGGWTLYSADNSWSGDARNPNPSVIIGGNNARVAGSINVPATTVAANSCVNLPGVANSAITAHSIIEFSNTQFWGTFLTVAPGPGSFTAYLCNPTTSSITTGSGTEYWRLAQ